MWGEGSAGTLTREGRLGTRGKGGVKSVWRRYLGRTSRSGALEVQRKWRAKQPAGRGEGRRAVGSFRPSRMGSGRGGDRGSRWHDEGGGSGRQEGGGMRQRGRPEESPWRGGGLRLSPPFAFWHRCP